MILSDLKDIKNLTTRSGRYVNITHKGPKVLVLQAPHMIITLRFTRASGQHDPMNICSEVWVTYYAIKRDIVTWESS